MATIAGAYGGLSELYNGICSLASEAEDAVQYRLLTKEVATLAKAVQFITLSEFHAVRGFDFEDRWERFGEVQELTAKLAAALFPSNWTALDDSSESSELEASEREPLTLTGLKLATLVQSLQGELPEQSWENQFNPSLDYAEEAPVRHYVRMRVLDDLIVHNLPELPEASYSDLERLYLKIESEVEEVREAVTNGELSERALSAAESICKKAVELFGEIPSQEVERGSVVQKAKLRQVVDILRNQLVHLSQAVERERGRTEAELKDPADIHFQIKVRLDAIRAAGEALGVAASQRALAELIMKAADKILEERAFREVEAVREDLMACWEQMDKAYYQGRMAFLVAQIGDLKYHPGEDESRDQMVARMFHHFVDTTSQFNEAGLSWEKRRVMGRAGILEMRQCWEALKPRLVTVDEPVESKSAGDLFGKLVGNLSRKESLD